MPNHFEIRSFIASQDDLFPDDLWIYALAVSAPWRVSSRWRIISGRLEPVEVTIDNAPDAYTYPTTSREAWHELGMRNGIPSQGQNEPPITAEVIRGLPLGEILAETRRAFRRELIRIRQEDPDLASHLEALGAIEPIDGQGAPQRGLALTADDLAKVADVYRAAWAAGEPLNQAVRDAFHLSRDGAAKRIGRAKKAGLLEGIGPKR